MNFIAITLIELEFQTFMPTSGSSRMFGLFKKKTEVEKLRERYKELLEESYKLSHTNRIASDKKAAEAEDILQRIEGLLQEKKTT